MIQGLTITPPILGRISIGKTVEKNGKRLPQKDDQFTITSQIQTKNGWVLHPLDEQLRTSSTKSNQNQNTKENKTNQAKTKQAKLRKIPVTMLFNDPELNLRAQYTMFDRQTGRPMCIGNGVTCQRRTTNGTSNTTEQHPCPSPENCALAKGGACKPFGRLYVGIESQNFKDMSFDELGAFIFRTTGFNSIRTLTARLAYYQAVSNGLLSYLPLQLVLRGKSSAQSYKQTVYYVDLTLQDGVTLNQAIQQARSKQQQQVDSGFNQEALDAIAKKGYEKSSFEVIDDESADVVNEFYNAETQCVEIQPTEQIQTVHHGSQAMPDMPPLNMQHALQQSVQQM